MQTAYNRAAEIEALLWDDLRKLPGYSGYPGQPDFPGRKDSYPGQVDKVDTAHYPVRYIQADKKNTGSRPAMAESNIRVAEPSHKLPEMPQL